MPFAELYYTVDLADIRNSLLEEGYIHRCSTSYNEQYLDTYQGHTGPVYKLGWSPFLKNCFLSASGDWTLKLWKVDRLNPCLTFNSSTVIIKQILTLMF